MVWYNKLLKVGMYLFAKHGTATTFTLLLYLVIYYKEAIPPAIIFTLVGLGVGLYTNLIKSGIDDLQSSLSNAKNFVRLVKNTQRETFEKIADIISEDGGTEFVFSPRRPDPKP